MRGDGVDNLPQQTPSFYGNLLPLMRPIWKGAISFGLVNIPVGLYSATSSTERIKFRLLRAKDQSPIRNKRVAEADGEEVPWEQIVKGYEFEKGRFVIITEEDFERVALKSNQAIEIKEFVDLEQIDPMFFDEPYFLGPEKGGDKAYSLLRDALKKAEKVGIAKVVLRTREHLAAVKPVGKALVLELMHFADELADPNQVGLPSVESGAKELEMAQSLVEAMSEEWQPDKYHDEYAAALMKVIEEKIAAGGKELPPVTQRGAAPTTNVVDIVAMLQESLKQRGKPAASEGKKKVRKPAKKRAA
jgi:DNA end-binding protein Ku